MQSKSHQTMYIPSLTHPLHCIPSLLIEIIQCTKIRTSIINVIKDIEYLKDMQRMETDKEFANSKRMAIVPISGKLSPLFVFSPSFSLFRPFVFFALQPPSLPSAPTSFPSYLSGYNFILEEFPFS